jgi:hypothetical protein
MKRKRGTQIWRALITDGARGLWQTGAASVEGSAMSHGAGQRAVRGIIFALAIYGAWNVFGTRISAEEARTLLLEDLNAE